MGRRKIKINRINDEKLRQITYCKRKKGLLKKAMELSLLCGNEVLLIICEASSNRTILYSSLGNDNHLFKNILANPDTTKVYNNMSVNLLVISSMRTCLKNR